MPRSSRRRGDQLSSGHLTVWPSGFGRSTVEHFLLFRLRNLLRLLLADAPLLIGEGPIQFEATAIQHTRVRTQSSVGRQHHQWVMRLLPEPLQLCPDSHRTGRSHSRCGERSEQCPTLRIGHRLVLIRSCAARVHRTAFSSAQAVGVRVSSLLLMTKRCTGRRPTCGIGLCIDLQYASDSEIQHTSGMTQARIRRNTARIKATRHGR